MMIRLKTTKRQRNHVDQGKLVRYEQTNNCNMCYLFIYLCQYVSMLLPLTFR